MRVKFYMSAGIKASEGVVVRNSQTMQLINQRLFQKSTMSYNPKIKTPFTLG